LGAAVDREIEKVQIAPMPLHGGFSFSKQENPMKNEFVIALVVPGLLLVGWAALYFFAALAPSIAKLMAVLGG